MADPSASASVFEMPISFSGSSSATSSAQNGDISTGGVNFAPDYTEEILIVAALVGLYFLIKSKKR